MKQQDLHRLAKLLTSSGYNKNKIVTLLNSSYRLTSKEKNELAALLQGI